jgi:hypothetical protein
MRRQYRGDRCLAAGEPLMGEVADQFGQLFVHLSRGLVGFLARPWALESFHEVLDRFFVAVRDVLAVVVLVHQVGERLVYRGAALGQRALGLGEIELAQHEGHQRDTGQGRTLERTGELPGPAGGLILPPPGAEVLFGVGVQVAGGEGLQVVVQRFAAEDAVEHVELVPGQGAGCHHAPVQRRVFRDGIGQFLQYGSALCDAGKLIEAVHEQLPV